jgi:tripartite-type tricarboxylate transporter receptor subunit TctC
LAWPLQACTHVEVQGLFCCRLTAPLAEAGQIVHVATTGQKRSGFTPDVPTVVKSGFPDFKVSGWLGLLGPKGMPADVVTQIGDDLRKIATSKAIVEQVGKVKMYTVLNIRSRSSPMKDRRPRR